MMMCFVVAALAILATWHIACVPGGLRGARSFRIEQDMFVKDGEPFTIRSGALHYFRVPPAYWRDRIQRMRAMGLNCLNTYVPWNFHEEDEGNVTFTGWRDVALFLQVAHEEGMLVILRPGPYICAEWEFGGLPAWLLVKENIKLRTWNEPYIDAVTRWWSVLLAELKRFTYSRGGPIIMVQLENEFGSYGDCEYHPEDARYMVYLLDLATRHLGSDVLYSTVDGGEGNETVQSFTRRLNAGSPWKGDPHVLATIDGPLTLDFEAAFREQADFNARGHSPKMWSELWVAFFTTWGAARPVNGSASGLRDGIARMVSAGASFDLYLAHGGTSFDFWSGANSNGSGVGYVPDITSYDYSAPIGEAGGHNVGSDGGDLFDAVRDAISGPFGVPPEEPAPIPTIGYGTVRLLEAAGLIGNEHILSRCGAGADPTGWKDTLPSMEQLGQWYGSILYRRSSASFQAANLSFSNTTVHDRAQVFVDGREFGTVDRMGCGSLCTVSVPRGAQLDVLVENMGRINWGYPLNDYKGLLGHPPIAGRWSAFCITLDIGVVSSLVFHRDQEGMPDGMPVFRRGWFHIDGDAKDTFFDSKGLTKGYMWVNGNALGRFWEAQGPQHTLYVPAAFLRTGDNELLLLDLHGSIQAEVLSVAQPRWTVDAHLGVLEI